MATVLMVPLILYLLAVLAGRHVHCKSNGAAAGLYDVTEYGAAPSSEDNKDVSALLQIGLAASCVFLTFVSEPMCRVPVSPLTTTDFPGILGGMARRVQLHDRQHDAADPRGHLRRRRRGVLGPVQER
uniref:Amino acid transporter transmembrane domain-containing protein n=1 Tax=Aegilops tauschii subsp. strangulata TaxID=200361 RepID=A0A453RQ73_AEGTS